MLDLSLNELQLIAKSRGIKNYKSKSEDKLIKILSEPKPKIEEIRKRFSELRDKFSKSKIKEIRRNLYKIENDKNKTD